MMSLSEIHETDQNPDFTTNKPDETGLTKPQKVALSGAWRLMKKDIVSHGRNIFVRFFEEHPKYISYFDFSQDSEATDLQDNKSLHAHALNMMNFIGVLIDYGLENPVMYKCSLAKFVKNHQTHNVTRDDIKVLCDVIIAYCLQTLDHHRSKTLDAAFAAFMESLVASYN
ncbi:hemoglobin-2 [Toxorhynchites rutilus septentrionalis]|uniref:hemoglobin-2 n=1 Tax=Toxorhynchites rutilus septentrionalis TaxID=329112 RepID=UPI002479BD3E|nr:hemoglobin-2 [Toxorhynchites rutilus septentrionalis]